MKYDKIDIHLTDTSHYNFYIIPMIIVMLIHETILDDGDYIPPTLQLGITWFNFTATITLELISSDLS